MILAECIQELEPTKKEALNKTVVTTFTAFMWNTTAYILNKEEQQQCKY